MSILKTAILIFTLVILSACASAYSSHHGNRGARYNNMPYRGNYQYNNYYRGSSYAGRPYRNYGRYRRY